MIHPQAVVDPGARIGKEVSVGAFSIIGPNVEIGDHTWVGPHVVINGPTRIGANNKIYQFASLGDAPQHIAYHGEPTQLVVGDNNTIREYVTFNRGTTIGSGVTTIGNGNFFMAYTHVAHDCFIRDNTIFANAASLAGHVEVDDYAILGGFTLVHQFCKIGAHSITAVNTVVFKDVPPYVKAAGYGAKTHGLNLEGMRRRNFDQEVIQQLKEAYRIVYRSGMTADQALDSLKPLAAKSPDVARFAEFIEKSERGIIRG
ncbi:MAG: acyl-ACP--UDP-N-acetylglucosamine O-acyltransferase [Acidiferrobacterales bacterium]|jgi:UDP-N-acetylglucosamine acyltransferase|nr:acyl-ACP--UDP-N-acetylglucosamine O-acyltransferase [Acidiferrobacterales bacterium]